MFDLLKFKPRVMAGYAAAEMHQELEHRQAIHLFENGYGVSVVQGPYTYGGRHGLYEMAVLVHSHNHEMKVDKWDITYETSLASPDGTILEVDDVIGFLTEEGVSHYMTEVSKLPKLPKYGPSEKKED
jgi:hypothetical protein